MQAVAITISTNGVPQSLGSSTTAAPSQGTVSTQGVTNTTGGAQVFGQVTIQNPPGTTGNLYVGVKGLNRTSLSGVGVILIPGASITIGNSRANVILDQVWVDADNSAQKVIYLAV